MPRVNIYIECGFSLQTIYSGEAAGNRMVPGEGTFVLRWHNHEESLREAAIVPTDLGPSGQGWPPIPTKGSQQGV